MVVATVLEPTCGVPLHAVGDYFGSFDDNGTDEDGATQRVLLLHFLDNGAELSFQPAVDDVRGIVPNHFLVGGDDQDIEAVDLVELLALGPSSSGHTGELFVEAEVVLEGDGGVGDALLLDFYAFLGFDGLVEAVRPAPAVHEATGELVYDNDLAVLDDVLLVAVKESGGAEGGVEEAGEAGVLGVVDVLDAERLLDFVGTVVGEGDAFVLEVGYVVLLGLEPRHDLGEGAIDVAGLLCRATDDERGPGLVDEDAVDLVDDGEVIGRVATLHLTLEVGDHVVAEVVEAEFVVSAVGDVGVVDVLAGGRNEVAEGGVIEVRFWVEEVAGVVLEDADGEAEAVVDLTHPLGVTLGEVVVDGDEVRAIAFERVEVHREGGDEGLALSGAHFGDLALMEDHTAEYLDVEGAHAGAPLGGFADDGEGFRGDVVERFAFGEAPAEFDGLIG